MPFLFPDMRQLFKISSLHLVHIFFPTSSETAVTEAGERGLDEPAYETLVVASQLVYWREGVT